MLDTQFLEVPYKSAYKYIIGKPFFVAIEIIASTAHLKMKYHNIYDESVSFHNYMVRSIYIHEILLKNPAPTTV